MKLEKIIKWIDDVRTECKKVVKKDLKQILKEIEKGKLEGNFYSLLMEIRDNERDEALLSLVKEIILEENKNGKCKRM